MNRNMKCTFGGVGKYLKAVFHEPSDIQFNTERHRESLGVVPDRYRLFALDNWLIQLKGGTVYIGIVNGAAQADELFIRFQKPNVVDVNLQLFEGSQFHEQLLRRTKMVRIRYQGTVGEITAITEEPLEKTATSEQTNQTQQPMDPQNEHIPFTTHGDEQRISQLSEQLRLERKKNQTLEGKNQDLEGKNQALERRNKTLEKENRLLQQQLTDGVERYLAILRQDSTSCDDALRQATLEACEIEGTLSERQGRLRQLERESADRKQEIQTLELKIEQMQQQSVERVVRLDELDDLDVERVQAELVEQRERLMEDSDVLALLADDPVLRVTSVNGAVEKIGKALDSAEKRLTMVVRLREKIDNAVYDTILRGDGTVAARIETGDGDGNMGQSEG